MMILLGSLVTMTVITSIVGIVLSIGNFIKKPDKDLTYFRGKKQTKLTSEEYIITRGL